MSNAQPVTTPDAKPKTPMTIRIYGTTKERVDQCAKDKGCNWSALVKMFVIAGLKREGF